MSVYGSYKLSDRYTLFGRYDDYTSENLGMKTLTL